MLVLIMEMTACFYCSETEESLGPKNKKFWFKQKLIILILIFMLMRVLNSEIAHVHKDSELKKCKVKS